MVTDWSRLLSERAQPWALSVLGMVTGPILLAGWREEPARGIGFLFGFYVAMVASLATLIIAFSSARRLGPRVARTLVGLSALALFGFGILQLARGLF